MAPNPLQFVFNELSARTLAGTRHLGHGRMNDLVDALATIMQGRTAELLSVGDPGIWGAELATGYTVAEWSAKADRDRRTLLLGIATKTELSPDVAESLGDRFYLAEFLLLEDDPSSSSVEARGLGASFVLNGVAVSLATEERWRSIRVPLRHVWLDEHASWNEKEVVTLNA